MIACRSISTNLRRECCVVVGPDAVSALRADSPDVPIVALVDAASPIQAVLAQAAGADVVLPTSDPGVDAHDDTPGLALAVRAAGTIAHGRREVARSSRQVGHDLAGALNVISLAAEVGTNGATTSDEAFAHITALAKAAADDAWRAGHAHRSSRRSLTSVDVIRVVRGPSTAGDDVEVVAPAGQAMGVRRRTPVDGRSFGIGLQRTVMPGRSKFGSRFAVAARRLTSSLPTTVRGFLPSNEMRWANHTTRPSHQVEQAWDSQQSLSSLMISAVR